MEEGGTMRFISMDEHKYEGVKYRKGDIIYLTDDYKIRQLLKTGLWMSYPEDKKKPKKSKKVNE